MTKKRFIFAALFLVIWFLVADAYWVSKQRDVDKCSINPALIEMNFKFHLIAKGQYLEAEEFARNDCSRAEGNGSHWMFSSGLSYAELLLLLPVANRIRFDG